MKCRLNCKDFVKASCMPSERILEILLALWSIGKEDVFLFLKKKIKLHANFFKQQEKV